MQKTRRRRPVVERLEDRVQLSTTMLFDYPWNFVGPIPVGSYRIASPGETALLSQAHGAQSGSRSVTPNVTVGGMSLSFPGSGQPLIGTTFTASLDLVSPTPYMLGTTTWTMVVAYSAGGITYTTPPLQISGAATSASIVASVPGAYTVTAVTTYTPTNPSVGPPPPTTVSASATFSRPDGATKGGSFLGVPITYPNTVTAVDTVTSGGVPVGSQLTGMAQESFDGGATWAPASPMPSFQLSTGKIQDSIGPAPTMPLVWDSIPVSATTPYATWAQALQIVWTLAASSSATGPGNYQLSAPLGTLNWSAFKLSATQWELQ